MIVLGLWLKMDRSDWEEGLCSIVGKSIFLSHLLDVSKKAFHPDCHSSYPCGSCDQAATLLRLKSMLWPAVERLKDLGPLTLCTWLNEPILKPPLPGTSFMCKKRFHFHLLLLVQCDLKKTFYVNNLKNITGTSYSCIYSWGTCDVLIACVTITSE